MSAPLQRPHQGEFIRVIQPTSRRKALGNAGDMAITLCKHLCQVIGGGLTLDIRSQGENHLNTGIVFNATDQLTNTQIFGRDIVQGRQLATEAVIITSKHTGSFQREDVSGLFHHTKFTLITMVICTHRTARITGKKPTSFTGAYRLLGSKD